MSDLKLTVTSWGQVVLDKRQVKALMRAAAGEIRTATSRMINKAEGGGRFYRGMGGGAYRGGYKAGMAYRASSPGSPPARVTGTLRGSLKAYVYPSGEGFAVRERAFYALFLEVGAFGGGPRARRTARRDHRTASAAQRQARALARGETRVLEERPSLDVVMSRAAKTLNARVERAMFSGLTWKQTK
jgi:hypothetical protein